MRRIVVGSILVGGLVVSGGAAGCAGDRRVTADPAGLDRAAASASAPTAAPSAPESSVYLGVLRRYLETPGENSFPDRQVLRVYVLDRAHADAADPMVLPGASDGVPIAADVQQRIAREIPAVVFIAERDSVIEKAGSCPQVKDGGILITLGTLDGNDREVRVGFNGFVACLGVTWLTYVVRNEPGTGWQVTGTTGPMSVA